MNLLLSIDVAKQNSREQKRAVKFHDTILTLGFRQLHSTLFVLAFAENADWHNIELTLRAALPPRGHFILTPIGHTFLSTFELPENKSVTWL